MECVFFSEVRSTDRSFGPSRSAVEMEMEDTAMACVQEVTWKAKAGHHVSVFDCLCVVLHIVNNTCSFYCTAKDPSSLQNDMENSETPGQANPEVCVC